MCRSLPLAWAPGTDPVPGTNERQNIAAARELLRAPWGGGPVRAIGCHPVCMRLLMRLPRPRCC